MMGTDETFKETFVTLKLVDHFQVPNSPLPKKKSTLYLMRLCQVTILRYGY